VLLSATGALTAADFWTTRRVISNARRERNPLAAPFARSDAGFAAYKVGTVGRYLGLGYFCQSRGRHKLERIVPIVSIASDGAAVGVNVTRVF